MAPKRRSKGQLTLFDFPKLSNPLTPPNSSTRPRPQDQSTQQKTLKLPRASIPSIFKTSPSTPKRNSNFATAADEAWEIGERILSGVNVNSRISYEENGREIPDDNSDADFEQAEVVHHVAKQRPSLKRKHATHGLRDDRASMTKRSANKKPKKRTPIKIATQFSMRLLDDDNLEDGTDQVGRREVIDQREVVLVDGEKSEMSGTDNEEADVSKYENVVKSSGNRRRVSLAGSVVTPTNRFKAECQGEESPYQTPEEFSLGRKGLDFNFRDTKAPRKTKMKPKRDVTESPRRKLRLFSGGVADRRSPSELARDKKQVSIFEPTGERSPNQTPSSTRKLVRRLHVSDSEPSEAGDMSGKQEGQIRGRVCLDFNDNDCNHGTLATTASRRLSQVQNSKEGTAHNVVSSEDDDKPIAALAKRNKSINRNPSVLPQSAPLNSIHTSKNRPRPSRNHRDFKSTEASGTGGCSESVSESLFGSKEVAPASSRIIARSREIMTRNPSRSKVHTAVSEDLVEINRQIPSKESLRSGIPRTTAENRDKSTSHHEVKSIKPRTENMDPSKRHAELSGERGDDFDVKVGDSESRREGPNIINIGSSSEGEDGSELDEDSEDSLQENSKNQEAESSQIVTRSVSRKAQKLKVTREPSPIIDFGGISDDSSGPSDDGSVQEVLPQDAVENQRTENHEAQTPERHRHVKSSFLHSGRKRISITPESSPSPPSSKKRFRRSKLATKDSEEDENGNLGTQLLETQATGRSPNVEQNGQEHAKKDGSWYHERNISNFSSSSSFDLRETPTGVKRRSSQLRARRRQLGLRVRRSPPIRKLDLESDSLDGEEDKRATSAEGHGHRIPLGMSLEHDGGSKSKTGDSAAGKDVKSVVIDLIDDIEAEPAEALPRDSADHGDEIRNSSSAGNSRKSEVEDVITVDDDEKPPPFNLIILCHAGESVREMLERLGEEAVLEKVTEAQNEGREVLGGDELGLTQSFNQGVFGRFSRTVVADQIGQKRKVKNVTEQALRGEYQFNYRGKGSERKGVRGGGNWYRGRGGRKAKGSGPGEVSAKSGTGRLANVRRRRR